MIKAFIKMPESAHNSCEGCYFNYLLSCPKERTCEEEHIIYVEDMPIIKVEFEVDD